MAGQPEGPVRGRRYGLGMRTLLVFEVEVDEGTRPSTRARRIDGVVRTTGRFLGRLRYVRALHSVSVCRPEELEGLASELRYDGRQLDRPLTRGTVVEE